MWAEGLYIRKVNYSSTEAGCGLRGSRENSAHESPTQEVRCVSLTISRAVLILAQAGKDFPRCGSWPPYETDESLKLPPETGIRRSTATFSPFAPSRNG